LFRLLLVAAERFIVLSAPYFGQFACDTADDCACPAPLRRLVEVLPLAAEENLGFQKYLFYINVMIWTFNRGILFFDFFGDLLLEIRRG
jgi:hypothetical protein